MPDEIRPALTPEEWAKEMALLEAYMGRDTAVSLVHSPGDVTHFVLRAHDIWRDEKYTAAVLATPHHLVRILALANAALPDGDSRKITRDDVQMLDDAASAVLGEAVFTGSRAAFEEAVSAKLDALAAKLAALLPPVE